MTEHTLKTKPPSFQLIKEGLKRFDIRRNDRLFQTGDVLHLIKWTDVEAVYGMSAYKLYNCEMHTCLRAEVKSMFSGDPSLRDNGGVLPGYVIMSLILLGTHATTKKSAGVSRVPTTD